MKYYVFGTGWTSSIDVCNILGKYCSGDIEVVNPYKDKPTPEPIGVFLNKKLIEASLLSFDDICLNGNIHVAKLEKAINSNEIDQSISQKICNGFSRFGVKIKPQEITNRSFAYSDYMRFMRRQHDDYIANIEPNELDDMIEESGYDILISFHGEMRMLAFDEHGCKFRQR